MPKRGAEDYLTKDGVQEDTNSTDRKHFDGTMSTPAQIARRRLATPKSRLNRGNSHNSNSSSNSTNTGNAFSTQQPAFGGANGNVFGQGNTQDQSSGGFNFAPSNASFSFSNDQSSTPNPFANMNQSSDQDTSMESPQKKQFLGNTESTNGSVSFGGFSGAAPPSQAKSLFNFNTSQTNGAGNGGFSFNAPSQPATSTLFGQPPQSQPSPAPAFSFGQSTSAPQEAKPAFSFGQSPSAQQDGGSSFSFGAPPAQQQASTSFTGLGSGTTSQPASSAPLFSFGQPAAGKAPSSAHSATTTTPPSSSPFKFAFGQTPTPSTSTESQSKPAESDKQEKPFQFGQTTGFGSSPGSSSLFGQPPKSLDAQRSGTETEASTASASTQKPSSIFNFSQNGSSSQGFKFGQSAVAPENSDSEKSAEGSSGNGGSEGKTTAAMPTPAKPEASANPPFADLFAGSPSKNLFGAAQATSTEPAKPSFNFSASVGQSQSGPITSNSSNTSSGGIFSSSKPAGQVSSTSGDSFIKAFKPQSEQSTKEVQSSTSDPSQSDKLSPSKPQTLQAEGTSTSNLFGKKTQSEPEPTPAAVSGNSESSSGVKSTSAQSQSNAPRDGHREPSKSAPLDAAKVTDSADPKRYVYTKAPARIPTFLNGEGYRDYDNSYALHSLNREFQHRIAGLDPQTTDFDNIIRHYVAARDSIGASLGLFSRAMAGMKRKNNDDEDDREVPNQYKKSKSNDSTSSSFNSTVSDNTASLDNPRAQGEVQTSLFSKASTEAAPQSSSPSKTNNASSSNSMDTPRTNSLFGSTKDVSNTATSTLDSTKLQPAAAPSTTPPNSPPKKTGFQMPQFAASAGTTNFLTSFAKSAESYAEEEKKKRKYEDVGSDEEDDPDWDERYEEEQRKKRAKFEGQAVGGWKPPSADTTATAAMPKPAFSFGASTTAKPASEATQQESIKIFGSASTEPKPAFSFGSSNAANTSSFQFGSGFKPNGAIAAPAKPHDEADGEDAGDERDDEDDDDQSDAGQDDASEDSLPEDDVDAEDGGEQETAPSIRNGGLFGRITRPDGTPINSGQGSPEAAAESPERQEQSNAPSSTFKPSLFGRTLGKPTPEQPSFSPLTPASGLPIPEKPYKPSPFNFTAPLSSSNSNSVEGASIFSGGAVKFGEIKGEGLFGSRPSTPSNVETQANPAAPVDQTWNPTQGFKFTSTPERRNDAPAINVSAATPSKDETTKANPFAGLFGQISSTAPITDRSTTLGFTFGAPSAQTAPGFLGAASHLLPGGMNSATSSAMSSRATSPGATDNESVGTDNTEDMSNEPQTSLTQSRDGEENCDVLFEKRTKALKFYTKDMMTDQHTFDANTYQTMGVGDLRILKDRSTNKTRVVLKSDPGAKVVLNDWLQPGFDYAFVEQPGSKNGAVKLVRMEDGKLRRWVLKFGEAAAAMKVSEILQTEKTAH